MDDETNPYNPPMPARRGPAAMIAGAMLGDGVDPADEAQVQAWMEAFNERPMEERDAILTGDDLDDGSPLRVVRLASDRELAAQAADTELLGHLRSLRDRVNRDGMALTETGDLRRADQRELVELLDLGRPLQVDDPRGPHLPLLDLVLAAARAAEVVVESDAVLVLGPGAQRLDDAPLDVLREVTAMLLSEGIVTGRYTDEQPPPWVRPLDEAALGLLAVLVDERELPVSTLEDNAIDNAFVILDPGNVDETTREELEDRVVDDLAWLLDRLGELGLIDLLTYDDGPEDLEPDFTAAITPLGIALTREHALRQGIEASVHPDLSTADAAVLLDAIGVWFPDDAAAELTAWLAARANEGEDGAAALIDVLLDRAHDPDRRYLTGPVTDLLPDSAEPQVRRLLDEPALRMFGQLWLVERGIESPAAIDPADAPAVVVENLALLLMRVGPDRLVPELHAAGLEAGALTDLIDPLWRSEHPQTEMVLTQLAEGGTGKVRKAARKALFKRGSR
jgi:hypothetical protein